MAVRWRELETSENKVKKPEDPQNQVGKRKTNKIRRRGQKFNTSLVVSTVKSCGGGRKKKQHLIRNKTGQEGGGGDCEKEKPERQKKV